MLSDALLALAIKIILQPWDRAAQLHAVPWITSTLPRTSPRDFVLKPKHAGLIPKRLETSSQGVSPQHYGHHLAAAAVASVSVQPFLVSLWFRCS